MNHLLNEIAKSRRFIERYGFLVRQLNTVASRQHMAIMIDAEERTLDRLTDEYATVLGEGVLP